MRNIVDESLKRFRRNKKRQQRVLSILLVLSVIVSGNVFWALRRPGVAMAGDAMCGLEEHSHTEACYEETLICGIPELQHEHTEACFETALLCEAAEHVHSLNCYADETADVETQLDWQAMFANYSFTNKLGTDLAEIAKTQIGYKESERNFVVDDDGTRHGYTRYGAWYGAPYGDWSAMFVSFCLNYAGGSNATTPFNTGANSMSTQWQALGLYASAGEYTPQAGDLVFFNDNTVGIVYRLYGDSITVIEGNVDDAVVSATIPVTDASIKGWGLTSKAGEPEPTPTPEESDQSGAVLTEEMLSSLSQYDAWAVLEESLVAPVSNMRTMALRANSGIALAARTGPMVDMTNMITEVEVEEKINGEWIVVGSDGTVTAGDELRFTVSYEVPARTLTNTDTIYYNLPNSITTVTAMQGNVYNSSKDVVGTFVIDNESKQIRITFNEEYVSKNAGDTTTDGQPINGSLSFRTMADSISQEGEQTQGIIFNDKVTVDLQVQKAETVNGDVHVEKTVASVTGNTITYEMKVSSTEGTYSPVQLTDTMTGGIVYVNGSLKVDGTAKTPTITENGFTLELPQMTAGGTYTVTYQAELPENAVQANNLVNNKVAAQSTDDKGNTIKDSSEVDHTFTVLDKRVTTNDGNGNISWTIEVNKSKLDISGWTLSDTIRINGNKEEALGATVVIKDSAGKTIYTGELPYKFLSGSNDFYTVTYTTSHGITGTNQTIINKAKLERKEEPPDNPIEDQGSVGIFVGDPLKKTGDVLEDTLETRKDGTQWVKVKWTVTIDTKDGPIGYGIPAVDWDFITDRTYSWYFMDKLDDDQYMTYDQLKAAVEAFQKAVSKYDKANSGSYSAQEYDINSDDGKTYYSNKDPKLTEGLLFECFRIDIPGTIPQGETITFSYECWAPYVGGTQIYKNHVNFNNNFYYQEEGEAHFVYGQPTVEKIAQWPGENDVPNENLDWRDWGGKSSDSNVNLDYESLFDGLMCWRIQVYIPSTYEGDLTVTEHLPEGLTISSLQVCTSNESPIRYLRWKNNGTELYQGFQWYGTDGLYQIPIEISANNDITFKVSEKIVAYILANIPEANKDEGGYKLYFYIFAQINDDAEWIEGEKDPLMQTATFANEVTLKDGNGYTLGTDTQTQVITKNLYKETVYKTATTPGDNIVPYEVVLNKDGLDLDPTSDTLTIEDLMEYVSPNMAPIRVRLVPGSVALETYSSKAGYEPTAVDFKYTYEELSVADSANNAVNWANKLLLTIPDETPVKLSYRYAVTGKEGQVVSLDNTCSITGVYEGQIEDNEALEMKLEEPVAEANITSVALYKVEEGDYSNKLAGAQFRLLRYEPDKGTYEQVKVVRDQEHMGEDVILTTDEKGAMVLHMDHDHADYGATYHLAYDTAYKLVEIKAPAGYYLAEHDYEFYISSGEEDANPIIPNPYTGHVLEGGDNIYFENERDTTEITVEKVWRDPENKLETDAVKDAHDSITLQLYQKTAGGEGRAYGDPIVLNGANHWKTTITGLPKAAYDGDKKGETYYYYVEEIDKPSGYTVSYTNNRGINSGSITVINTKASAYVLPETGGPGVLLYVLLGMTLITIPIVYGYKQRRKHEGRGVR